jgi:hypothetical protein
VILYSIIPPEFVFQGFMETNDQQQQLAEYRGEKIMVTKRPDNHFEITRLLSTRPASFLDPVYQPGNLVDERDLKKIRP